MKKLQSLIFGKKANVPSDKVRTEYGDVGIVFAPGPDKGLYIKGIVKGSPAWEKNCSYLESQGQRDANDGSDGAIRIGDCLLDIQEVDKADKKARGKKYDVFAKPEDKVLSILKKMQSPFVEFSFRRIAPSGDSALITVLLERKERTGNNEIQANQAIAEIRQRQVRERMTEIDMRFAEIDEDGSGSVTLEELLLFLQNNPMEDQTRNPWEIAHFLFTRADADRSGELASKEFESVYAMFQNLFREHGRRRQRGSDPETEEEAFRRKLEDLREELLSMVQQHDARDFRRMLALLSDPEDLYLMRSMFQHIPPAPPAPGDKAGDKGEDEDEGMCVLKRGMMATRRGFFYECVVRVYAIVRAARSRMDELEGLRQIDDEERAAALQQVAAAFPPLTPLTEDDIAKEREQCPMVRNAAYRCPGRNLVPRRWPQQQPAERRLTQREFQLPEPFLGRADTVLHLMRALESHRLITIVGPPGCGKSALAEAVLHTIQERSRVAEAAARAAGEEVDGAAYMYADGVHRADCGTAETYERMQLKICQAFQGSDASTLQELLLFIRECMALLVLDGVDLVARANPKRLRDGVFQMLQGSPGLTLIITCSAPVGIPHEHIVAVPELCDADTAEVVRLRSPPGPAGLAGREVYSAHPLVKVMGGNPLCARIAAALLQRKVPASELLQILTVQRDTDAANLAPKPLETVAEWNDFMERVKVPAPAGFRALQDRAHGPGHARHSRGHGGLAGEGRARRAEEAEEGGGRRQQRREDPGEKEALAREQEAIRELKRQSDLVATPATRADPWSDASREWFTADGKPYGSGLCLRAWIRVFLGTLESGDQEMCDLLRLLCLFPSGLSWAHVSLALPSGVKHRLDTLIHDYGLVTVRHRSPFAADAEPQAGDGEDGGEADGEDGPVPGEEGPGGGGGRGRGKLLYVLNLTVGRLVAATQQGRMTATLRCMLHIVVQQLELECLQILRVLDDNGLRGGPGGYAGARARLGVWEDNLWAAADADRLLSPDVFGEDVEMAECIGRLALALGMVLLPLNRLTEARSAVETAHRAFTKLLHFELLPAAVSTRRANPGVHPVKAPAAIGSALRVLAEVKMGLGAYRSALKDLELAYAQLEPLSIKPLALDHRGVFVCRADVLWLMAECHICIGDEAQLPRASQVLATSLGLYQDAEDDVGRAVALQLKGHLLMMTGKMVDSYKALSESVLLLQRGGDLDRLAETLCLRAQLCIGMCNLAMAREDLESALEILKKQGNLVTQSIAWRLTAECEMAVNDHHRAYEALLKCKAFARAVFSEFLEATAEQLLGDLFTNSCVPGETKPQLKRAAGHLERALALFQAVGNKVGIGNTQRALARVCRLWKQWGEAKERLGAALEAFRAVGTKGHALGIAVVQAEMAEIEAKLSKGTAAPKRNLETALATFENVTKELQSAHEEGLFESVKDRNREQRFDLSIASRVAREAPRVESHPFWSKHLHKLNPKSGGVETAGDLVREVFGTTGTVWDLEDGRYRNDPTHIERKVGTSGIAHLDMNQIWSESRKWEYSDDRDLEALEKVQQMYMLASDRPRREKVLRKNLEIRGRFLDQIGLRTADGSIDEGQVRKAFKSVDLDGSGTLDMGEVNKAFTSIGVFLDEEELEDMFRKFDPDGNGLDEEEFVEMLTDFIDNIRQALHVDDDAAAAAAADASTDRSLRPRKTAGTAAAGTGTAGGDSTMRSAAGAGVGISWSAFDGPGPAVYTARPGAAGESSEALIGAFTGPPAGAGPPINPAGAGAEGHNPWAGDVITAEATELLRHALQVERVRILREELARRQAAR